MMLYAAQRRPYPIKPRHKSTDCKLPRYLGPLARGKHACAIRGPDQEPVFYRRPVPRMPIKPGLRVTGVCPYRRLDSHSAHPRVIKRPEQGQVAIVDKR